MLTLRVSGHAETIGSLKWKDKSVVVAEHSDTLLFVVIRDVHGLCLKVSFSSELVCRLQMQHYFEYFHCGTRHSTLTSNNISKINTVCRV